MKEQLAINKKVQKEANDFVMSFLKDKLEEALHSLFVDILKKNPILKVDYSWSDFSDYLFDNCLMNPEDIDNTVFNLCLVWLEPDHIKYILNIAKDTFIEECGDEFDDVEEVAQRRCDVLETEVMSKIQEVNAGVESTFQGKQRSRLC